MCISAVGGMGAATFCHPIDVIRIQMQLFPYRGTFHAAKSIASTQGIGALYSGVTAAYLRQWTYGSCRMGAYSFMLNRAKSQRDGPVPFTQKLLMGCLSGGVGSFTGTPSELAMVRMGADKRLPEAERRGYKNVFDCIVRVAREEGPTALWKGSGPTVIRAMLLSSSSLGIYSECKERLPGLAPALFPKADSASTMMVGTTLSSIAANLLCTPFDVVKSRIQNQPAPSKGKPAMYTGMVDCFVKGVRAEGPLFLYRGFVPACIKLTPYTTISLILTDKMMRFVTGKSGF
eukprot:jgi/Bigna1/44307/e_gw1.93.20.1